MRQLWPDNVSNELRSCPRINRIALNPKICSIQFGSKIVPVPERTMRAKSNAPTMAGLGVK